MDVQRTLDQLEPVTPALNATSIGVAVASFFSILPNVAALFSVLWLGLQIYRHQDTQRLIGWVKRKLGSCQ